MRNIKLITLFTIFMASLGCETDEQTNANDENAITCIPSNLQASVIAYYPFTNGSIDDFSGNNQNLINTTSASTTSDRNANENCAFEFNFLSGTNAYLSTANTASLDAITDFSISLWYQPLQNRDAGSYERLIGRDFDFEKWNLGLYDCRKAVFVWTGNVWDDHQYFGCGESDLNNEWHQLVATYDNSTHTMRLYRNGVLQETSDVVYNATASHVGDLIIGNEYTGKIDDIIIFDVSLNQSEVNALYNMEPCCN